jgi:hypothetical protein
LGSAGCSLGGVMVKSVRVPDEEYCHRRDALFKVLDSFGLSPNHSPWVSYSVHLLVKTVTAGIANDVRAIKPGPERKKLLKAMDAAKILAKKMRALNPQVMYVIMDACSDVAGQPRKVGATQTGRVVSDVYEDPGLDSDFWTSFWEIAGRLDHVMDHIAPDVNRYIDAAPNAGRRDLVSIKVVHALRLIWEEALNRGAAPRSLNDAGEFAEFLAGAFEALGLQNNPRAAMDSWREYNMEYPEGDGWH